MEDEETIAQLRIQLAEAQQSASAAEARAMVLEERVTELRSELAHIQAALITEQEARRIVEQQANVQLAEQIATIQGQISELSQAQRSNTT